jgi:prevent-host-death family protein
MRDHLGSGARSRRAKNVVGVRELKTHAARILRHVREARASYILTHRGRAVGVILPLDPTDDDASSPSEDADARAAWDAFLGAGRRLERRFRPGRSGVRLLSAMRR